MYTHNILSSMHTEVCNKQALKLSEINIKKFLEIPRSDIYKIECQAMNINRCGGQDSVDKVINEFVNLFEWSSSYGTRIGTIITDFNCGSSSTSTSPHKYFAWKLAHTYPGFIVVDTYEQQMTILNRQEEEPEGGFIPVRMIYDGTGDIQITGVPLLKTTGKTFELDHKFESDTEAYNALLVSDVENRNERSLTYQGIKKWTTILSEDISGLEYEIPLVREPTISFDSLSRLGSFRGDTSSFASSNAASVVKLV